MRINCQSFSLIKRETITDQQRVWWELGNEGFRKRIISRVLESVHVKLACMHCCYVCISAFKGCHVNSVCH